ncbi:zf-HC2 domain-containing protein [Microbulbifer sediminum]|uniref:zf-HC2 domain-containing protein n=1 Tax=Microbulbifer sediminum TaxID=2904250 RepID=UPI001F1F7B49
MKSCREVTRLLSEAQERQLDGGERLALRLHLMICGACRNFSHQMTSLRHIARAYARGAKDEGAGGPPGKGRGKDTDRQ